MADEFDPYRMWLGIPPEEQPPNIYRLLGIGLFEADLDVIQEAADRQMAHVQRHKLGRYAVPSQKLLNELSSARLCLLKADRKELYDRKLRAKLAAQSRPAEVAPPVAAPPASAAVLPQGPAPLPAVESPREDLVATPSVAPQALEVRSRRTRQKSNRTPLLVAGGAAMALVIGIGLMLSSRQKPDEPKPVAVASTGRVTAQSTDDEQEPTVTPTKVKAPAISDWSVPPDSEPAESDSPDATEMTDDPEESATTESPASEPAPAEPTPGPPAVAPVAPSPEPAPQPVPAPLARANFELAGHTSHITCIAVNPADPNQVVSGSFEFFPATPLRAWDLVGRQQLPDLIRNADHEPCSVCFSADGRFLAHGAQNGAHVQQLGTKNKGFYGNNSSSVSLVKPADQRLLLAQSGQSGGIVWDATNVSQGEPFGSDIMHFGEMQSANVVLFAPDASRIYAGQGGAWTYPAHEFVPGNNFKLRVMDMLTAQSEFVPGHTGTIGGLALSRDGSRLATASEDHTLRIWDSKALKSLRTLNGHEGPVYAVAMSPDGRFVLSGGADKTVRLWDAKSGQEIQKFSEHTDIVRAVALTPDGKYAISGGNDKLLRVWDLQGLIPTPGVGGPKVAGGVPAAAQKRVAVPDAAAVETADKLIREVFADDFKIAKKPAEKVALAEKLLQQAGESQSEPERYALFSEARTLAGSGGNPVMALQIIEQMSGRFEVDSAQETAAYLEPLLKKGDGLSGPARKELAEALLPLTDGAVARGDFETARRLLTLASTSARKTNDTALIRQITVRAGEVNDAKKLFDAYQKAEAKLAANADDVEAHLAAGKYLCFVKQDWIAGLPHLARGSDAALREAAEADVKSPSAAEEQVKVGDLWWALAEQAKGKDKADYAERCDKWYSTALPGLKGASAVQTKVSQADQKKLGQVHARPRPGAVADGDGDGRP